VAAEYSFLTPWLLAAPRQQVWELLEDTAGWPQWWRGVARVEQRGAVRSDGAGGRHLVEWRSRVPYSVVFEFEVERVQAPLLMEGSASGDLAGRGCWRLYEEAGVTAVVYEWHVRTTKTWMNLVSPIARPIFEWNHDAVMRWGGEGLARRLGVALLAAG
jgi:uncharacterized protein YndB with AHSA1/START domain